MPLCQEHDESVRSPGGEYVIGNTIIGQGATSIIKLAFNLRTNEPAAVKMVNLLLYSNYFQKELSALSRISHQNIVKLLDYKLSDDKSSGVLFLEYLPFPCLFDHIQKFGGFSEEICWKILSQIVDAFKYLHDMGLCHGDFKPENVMYDHTSHRVKILDFGLTRSSDEKPQFIGSPLYMAPEVHLRKPYDVFLADVWSIGICFCEMLTGDTPFRDCQDTDDLLDCLLCDDGVSFLEDLSQNLSANATNLLKKMLTRDPRSRITINGVKQFLENLGFNENTDIPHQPS